MNEPTRDTIFALSSGRPPAAIAVIRVAGPRARAALEALGVKVPEPRRVGLARFRDPASGEIIDEGLVLFFEAAKSEVGEDTAELQPHGGRAIIAALLAALGRIDGLRPAEAGEFTRRAFENGKMDLTAVEGLADLVMAETEGQRRLAYRQMRGALGKRADAWREKLIQALALVEARIDFSDEGDVPEDLLAPALDIARALEAEIAGALADGQRGERLRDGLVVAIAGPPNAGKSTLLNRIARREAAIVSPYAGTTRDVIEVHLDLGGLPVTLLDTAGIRETDDPVELEGVRRAEERAAAADLVLWVVDASTPEPLSGATQDLRSRATAEESRPQDQAIQFLRQAGGNGHRGRADRLPPGPGGDQGQAPQGDGLRKHSASQSQAEPGDSVSEMSDTWVQGTEGDVPPGRSAEGLQLRRRGEVPDAAGGWTPMPRGRAADAHAAKGVDGKSESVHPHWLVLNKADLYQGVTCAQASPAGGQKNERIQCSNDALTDMVYNGLRSRNGSTVPCIEHEFIVSALSGDGLLPLLDALEAFAGRHLAGSESALITRARHRRALEDALAALRRALNRSMAEHEDLLAEELRLASRALGRLIGRVDVEDVLDVIFRDFCIGK